MSPELAALRDAIAHRYAIDRELGRGGMATVYLAKDRKHERSVALKVLHPELAVALGPERFLREIEIAANLSHPHILPLHDSGQAAGFLWYVMPYVDGETLRDRLGRETVLPVEEATRLAEQVALALAYAHQKGVIHRDVKPSNILLSTGQAVVADFGVAYAAKQAQRDRLTATGMPIGSPRYMSPEQASGKKADARSDIYSLGCVLYEMLTGEAPFDGPTAVAIATSHLRHEIPSPRAKRSEISPVLEETVKTALAKDPDERFSDAAEFAAALRMATPRSGAGANWLRSIPSPLSRLRKLRVIEWSLTYLAVAWLIVQVIDALADVWPLSITLQRSIQLLLALGFFGTIVLAWEHGKGGKRGIPGSVLLTVAIVSVAAAAALSLVIPSTGTEAETTAVESSPLGSIERDKPSIAVLPLDNISPNPDDSYFAAGMHEEIIAELSKISALEVIARTSVMKYAGTSTPVRDIVRELSVDYVLAGSTRIDGDRVLLTAQLIDGRREANLWSEEYRRDRTVAALFDIQDDIARLCAASLSTRILPDEAARLESRPTEIDPAYFAYLRGRRALNEGTPNGFSESAEFFRRAIEFDPGFAKAYAGLADVYNSYGSFFFMPSRVAFDSAKAQAAKALNIDNSLAEGHASLGYARLNGEWDWAGAEASLRRAIELNDSYEAAHVWYGQLLVYSGRFAEGLAELRRAASLDPLSAGVRTSLGWGLYLARRYEESLAELHLAQELNPGYAAGSLFTALPLLQLGKHDEAIVQIERAIQLAGRLHPFLALLGVAYGVAGRTEEALGIVEELKSLAERQYVPDEHVATIYIHVDRYEDAFDWLESAYDEGSYGLIYLKVTPQYDPIRSDRRFEELLRRVGLTP